MNILLVCNKKNLLGNKFVIYSTLYCNSDVDWFICLTEEIGEQEQISIQNLVSYLDNNSTVIFETLDKEKSLEEQFNYLMDFWYIAPDCMVAQNIEDWYDKLQNSQDNIVINRNHTDRVCTAYIDLLSNRKKEYSTFIDYDNHGLIFSSFGDEKPGEFDTRIGFCGKFSFNFNMPIIFWFAEENKKIYETNLTEWFELYPEFEWSIKQIQLVETIHF